MTQEALFHTAIKRELGPEVLAAFENPDVTDLYTNVDGSLWCDTHSQGRYRVPACTMAPERITRFLNVLATASKIELGTAQLHLDTELPAADFARARVRGWLPPITEQPVVIIRKHSSRLFSLVELSRGGLFPEHVLPVFEEIVANGESILVVGATGSGKTTLLNALLEQHARLETGERLLVLEDTLELQLRHSDVLRLRTTSGSSAPHPLPGPLRQGYGLRELVKGGLRSAPDRIIVGEVRDASALDLLDAWATGHRGGFATLHAETVQGAILRLDRLAQRNRVPSQRALIFEAVNWIAVLEKTAHSLTAPEVDPDRAASPKSASRKAASPNVAPPRRLVELARLYPGGVTETRYPDRADADLNGVQASPTSAQLRPAPIQEHQEEAVEHVVGTGLSPDNRSALRCP